MFLPENTAIAGAEGSVRMGTPQGPGMIRFADIGLFAEPSSFGTYISGYCCAVVKKYNIN